MPDFVYPSSIALRQIEQELMPSLTAQRAAFDFMPMVDEDADVLEWEQKDNYTGLQQVRGLNGDPGRVKQTGGKRYIMEPGYYGEFEMLDERQLTKRRAWGTFAGSVNVADLVREAQDKLLQRRLDRVESIIWTLVSTGTFSVADFNSVQHTDAYTTQTFAAGTAWSTFATSTPLADVRAVQLKSRGYSVDFGAGARMYMNRSTFNSFLSNTNANDLGGRRGAGLSTINGPEQLNQLLAMDDLPAIVIYDRGYIDDTGTFQLFIPNSKVVVVGRRLTGDSVGQYRMTRNAQNPNMGPGAYTKVVDDPDEVPRNIRVHDGHNGGPVLWHPAAIVVMSV